MRQLSEVELKYFINKLNDLVLIAGQDSTIDGLSILTYAFAALLDIYALPNPGNPQGMCDDPIAFRKIFSDILFTGNRGEIH